jgi:hypothetical protein
MNTALAHGMRNLTAAEILMVSGGESDGGWGGGDGGWGGSDYGSTMDGFNDVFSGPAVDYSLSVSADCLRDIAYGAVTGFMGGYKLGESYASAIAGGLIGGLAGMGTGCFGGGESGGGSN